ncbi:MAG: hypothetical protein C4B56_06465 [Candidatus Methanophagaceae archaeon]|nr:MAG: hypothetical protein C4B56_06465 [Methanophagales archaeon]
MDKNKNTSKNKSKSREEYIEDLKKTLTPLIFGILAGVICFSLYTASPRMVVDDTGGTMVAYLDKGLIPANLSAQFKDKGIPLNANQNLTVLKEGADKWLIGNEYIIKITKSESAKLNVYPSPVSENWFLIALLLILVQKFVYPYMHTRIEGAKDWLYIGFISAFGWFISFTLLLAVLF